MSCKFNLVPFVCPTFKQTGFVVNSFQNGNKLFIESYFEFWHNPTISRDMYLLPIFTGDLSNKNTKSKAKLMLETDKVEVGIVLH